VATMQFIINMKVSTREKPPILLSKTTIKIVMEFKYIMGTSFTKFQLFFHKVSFIINTLFPPL
jgi:hypothetical protein